MDTKGNFVVTKMERDLAPQNVADPAPEMHRKRGRPAVSGGKQHVNLRLDNEVLSFYRAGGPGWQTRVNDVLRKAMADKSGC